MQFIGHGIQNPVGSIGSVTVSSPAVMGSAFTLVGLTNPGGAETNLQLGNWSPGSSLQWGCTSTVATELTRLQFDTGAAGGAPTLAVTVSVNGGAASTIASDFTPGLHDFTLTGLTGVTSATFNLLVENANTFGGTLLIGGLNEQDGHAGTGLNFTLDGNIAAIPEPSSAVLLGLGVAALARRRRRSC